MSHRTKLSYTPAGLAARFSEMERQIADLQRSRGTVMHYEEATGSGPAVIDLGDGVAYTGYTRAFSVRSSSTLVEVTGLLSQAGSTDTVAQVGHDGVYTTTLTIPAGSTSATVSVGEAFDAGDLWQMYVQTVGTGAAGLAFFGNFS